MWMLFCQTHLDCSVIKVYGTLVRRATCVVVMSVSYTCDASFWQLDRCVLYELWGRVMWYVSFNVNGWCHHVWWRHVVLPALWGPNIVSDKQHIILKWGRFEKSRTFLESKYIFVEWETHCKLGLSGPRFFKQLLDSRFRSPWHSLWRGIL